MPTRVRVQRERVQRQALSAFSADNPEFNNSIMQVGVVDATATYPDGTKVVDVVRWNEYGTSKIPARPAFRRSISRTAPKLAEIGAEQAREMLHGKLRFNVAARRLAKLLAEDMQKAVESFRTPPNAPSTIRKKGFNNPLIETRLMVRSITYKLLKTRKDQL